MDCLCQALKLTHNHENLISLEYRHLDGDDSEVIGTWVTASGIYSMNFNVSLDSGSSMIRDIVNNID